MFCDLDAACGPHAVMGLDVIKEPLQGGRARRAPDDAAVQADREHFRLARNTFGIEHVERVPQMREELVTVGEARGRSEAHVVGVQRIRHDEVIGLADTRPVRQIVSIRVGVVEKAPVFDDQIAGAR